MSKVRAIYKVEHLTLQAQKPDAEKEEKISAWQSLKLNIFKEALSEILF